jgi:hypothetical protein
VSHIVESPIEAELVRRELVVSMSIAICDLLVFYAPTRDIDSAHGMATVTTLICIAAIDITEERLR